LLAITTIAAGTGQRLMMLIAIGKVNREVLKPDANEPAANSDHNSDHNSNQNSDHNSDHNSDRSSDLEISRVKTKVEELHLKDV
jgi:hypothetical protein